jgi:hypothetical protein
MADANNPAFNVSPNVKNELIAQLEQAALNKGVQFTPEALALVDVAQVQNLLAVVTHASRDSISQDLQNIPGLSQALQLEIAVSLNPDTALANAKAQEMMLTPAPALIPAIASADIEAELILETRILALNKFGIELDPTMLERLSPAQLEGLEATLQSDISPAELTVDLENLLGRDSLIAEPLIRHEREERQMEERLEALQAEEAYDATPMPNDSAAPAPTESNSNSFLFSADEPVVTEAPKAHREHGATQPHANTSAHIGQTAEQAADDFINPSPTPFAPSSPYSTAKTSAQKAQEKALDEDSPTPFKMDPTPK